MMYAGTDKVIHDKAELIMKAIINSRLYGEPVDLNNPEQLLYVAYVLGVNDATGQKHGYLFSFSVEDGQ